MSNIYYEKQLRALVDTLTTKVSSKDEYDKAVRDNLGPITALMRIARVELKCFTSDDNTSPDNRGNVEIISIDDEWNKDCSITINYPVFGSSQSVCTYYAEKDYFWSEKEMEDVKFLGQLMYVIGGNMWHLENSRKAAVTDLKTGLPNISAFASHCERIIEEKRIINFTIGALNIKNFRYMTQKMGSRKTDEILKKFGTAIMSFLKEDEKIAILGGDNFAVIINNERVDRFIDFLSKISVPINTGSNIVSYDISVRAGLYEARECDQFNDIMNAAFVGLDVAKTKGTSDYVKLDPYVMKRIMREKEISNVFPEALKDMEFSVFYQPKVDLNDNSVCGGEALVRWMKDGKIIPPMEFIPVLEKEGKVSDIDFFVFETVCKSIGKWIDMGIEPVRISVNFSKLNLYNRNLSNEILAVMNKYGISSEYIEIELTEMSGYEDYDALSVFINNMKQLGIKTSIDDFGTGYSSFNLIKDLNADIIKLDKSFLTNIDNKMGKNYKVDEIVIRNVVNMVNELEMEVIAEGVETIAQAEFLKQINCLQVQGFLFDKPLPEAEFEKILAEKKHYSLIAI